MNDSDFNPALNIIRRNPQHSDSTESLITWMESAILIRVEFDNNR